MPKLRLLPRESSESALTALIRDLQVEAVLQKQGDKTAYFPKGRSTLIWRPWASQSEFL